MGNTLLLLPWWLLLLLPVLQVSLLLLWLQVSSCCTHSEQTSSAHWENLASSNQPSAARLVLINTSHHHWDLEWEDSVSCFVLFFQMHFCFFWHVNQSDLLWFIYLQGSNWRKPENTTVPWRPMTALTDWQQRPTDSFSWIQVSFLPLCSLLYGVSYIT